MTEAAAPPLTTPAAPKATPSVYLPLVDMLRFLSASLIMIYHFGYRAWRINGESTVPFPELLKTAALPLAVLAVPLFFIISGFVISLSAEGKTAGDFARSRFTRLFPVFWLCCTLTWIITGLWGPEPVRSSLTTYLANLTMLHGFAHLPNVDAAYWTLTVELRFYFFVFLAICIGQYRRMPLLMGLWLSLSLAHQLGWLTRGESFFAAEHAPHFVLGYFLSEWLRRRMDWQKAALTLLAASMSLARVIDFARTDTAITGVLMSPSLSVAIMLLIYLLFAWLCLQPTRLASWAPAARIMGGMTYPLYLLHNFVGITLMQQMHPQLNRWLNLALTLALSYLISWLIWRFYEKPAMSALRRLTAPKPAQS